MMMTRANRLSVETKDNDNVCGKDSKNRPGTVAGGSDSTKIAQGSNRGGQTTTGSDQHNGTGDSGERQPALLQDPVEYHIRYTSKSVSNLAQEHCSKADQRHLDTQRRKLNQSGAIQIPLASQNGGEDHPLCQKMCQECQTSS